MSCGFGICPLLSQVPSGSAQEHGRANVSFIQHSWKAKAMFGSKFLGGVQQVKCLPCKHEDLISIPEQIRKGEEI